MRRRKKRLSPRAMQALIWGAAITACTVFAVVVFVVTGRGRPVLPEPATVPVSPEVAPNGQETLPSPDEPTPEVAAPSEGLVPGMPGGSPTSTPPNPGASEPKPPRKLTEGLFIEISAQMLVAADSFTDSDVGQRSYERACEGILEQQGVSRPDFEKLEEGIAQDPKRQARVVDQVLERADQLRHPTNVRTGTGSAGVVDPRRAPPPPPTPPR